MRVLMITPMWPSARDPDFGAFLVPHVDALRRLGHDVTVVSIDRRGGSPRKYAGLAVRAVASALRLRPDVVVTHTLFPAGAAGVAAAAERVLAARGLQLITASHGDDAHRQHQLASALVERRVDALLTA